MDNNISNIFLSTARISNQFCKEKNTIYLGPWAVPLDQSVEILENPHKFIPNPWDNRKKYYEAFVYTDKVYEKFLILISEYLNNIFNVELSLQYWRILIGFWLWHYIESFYDRYVLIKKGFQHFPDAHTVLLDQSCFITPFDMDEFLKLSISSYDFYNFQLFSQIITGLGKNFQKNKINFKNNKVFTRTSLFNKLKIELKKKIIQSFSSNFLKAETIFNGQIDYRAIITLNFNIKEKIGFINSEFPQKIKEKCFLKNLSYHRKNFETFSKEDEFETLLVNSLAINFPLVYLEGFLTARKYVLDKYIKKIPRIFCSVCGLMSNGLSKYYAAELSENGVKIINIQHGGNYGISKFSKFENHEIDTSNVFGCWGWAVNNAKNCSNIPSIKLSQNIQTLKLNKAKIVSNTKILMVGTAHPQYLYRIWSFPVGTQWYDYINDCVHFCEELGFSLSSEIIYRPYPHEYGWNFAEIIKNRVQNVIIDDRKLSFLQMLGKSKIVVCDHNSTIFLEALAYNHPTVVFFNPVYFELKVKAKKYFDMLIDAGILFDNPIDAAKMVKRHYHTVFAWWNSEKVQTIRKKFVDHFAYSTSDWLSEWKQFLEKA